MRVLELDEVSCVRPSAVISDKSLNEFVSQTRVSFTDLGVWGLFHVYKALPVEKTLSLGGFLLLQAFWFV